MNNKKSYSSFLAQILAYMVEKKIETASLAMKNKIDIDFNVNNERVNTKVDLIEKIDTKVNLNEEMIDTEVDRILKIDN